MIVAIIALVVAASGTAVAATKLVSGDSTIQKNSLSGNRLRNHSVYWSKIKWSSVGTVPSAKNATNAVNATNAASLGGQAPSAFEPAANYTRTGFITTSEGNTVTVVSFGPFTLQLKCVTDNNGNPEARLIPSSSQTFSTADGQSLKAGAAGDPIDTISPSFNGGSSTSFADFGPGQHDFTTPGGGLWTGQVDLQNNNPGNGGQCGAFAVIQKVH